MMRRISSLWDCKFTKRCGHCSAEPHAVSICDRCALNLASIWTLCFTAQLLVSPEVPSIRKDVAVTCLHCTSSPCSNPTSGHYSFQTVVQCTQVPLSRGCLTTRWCTPCQPRTSWWIIQAQAHTPVLCLRLLVPANTLLGLLRTSPDSVG